MTWSKGYAEWTTGKGAFISVAFTWLLEHARTRALWLRQEHGSVRVGGPAVFHPRMREIVSDVADEVGGDLPDAVSKHNPNATFASRGCPVGCWFCIVPRMEGERFTLIPDFPVRPVLCDNNLSALPFEYQEHIVGRYRAEEVPLLDANSGFEPRTFSEEIYRLWKTINRGPWRFAYDDLDETDDVARMMRILQEERPNRKRVYVLIGNEPFEPCMERIERVIEWGGIPHVQPFIKLTALQKEPHARRDLDWTVDKLRAVSRWANGFLWRQIPFSEYDRKAERRAKKAIGYQGQTGLFEASS